MSRYVRACELGADEGPLIDGDEEEGKGDSGVDVVLELLEAAVRARRERCSALGEEIVVALSMLRCAS